MKRNTFMNRTIRYALTAVGLGLALQPVLALPALAEKPAVHYGSAVLVSPTDADIYYASGVNGSNITHTTARCPSLAVGPSCTTQHDEITVIAKALGADRLPDPEFIKNAFEYVYNSIGTTPLFGLTKGALGAQLDGYGTSFDQAALLVALLRQSPSVTATYQYGTVTLSGAQFANLFGPADGRSACRLLANGGIPAKVDNKTDCSLVSNSEGAEVVMAHVRVEVFGTGFATQILDPSIKNHEIITGTKTLAAIDTAAGLNPPDLVSAALNGTTGIAAKAEAYATALQANIRPNSQVAALSTDELLGARRLQPFAFPANGAVSYFTNQTGAATPTNWTNIPDAYRTKITVVYGNINEMFYADEVYGRPMSIRTITEDVTRGVTVPRLYIDEALIASASSIQNDFTIGINHPYAADSGAYMDRLDTAAISKTLASSHRAPLSNGTARDTYTNQFDDAHRNISIVFGLGDIDRIRPDQDRLTLSRSALQHVPFSQGYNSLAHRNQRQVVISEWMAQVTRLGRLFEQAADVYVQQHHTLGYLNDSARWTHFDAESGFSLIGKAGDTLNENPAKITHAALLAGLEGFNAANASGATKDRSTPSSFAAHASTAGVGPSAFAEISKTCSGVPLECSTDVYDKLTSYAAPAKAVIAGYVLDGYRVVADLNPVSFLSGTDSDISIGALPDLNLSPKEGNHTSAFVAIRSNDSGVITHVAHMIAADPSNEQFIKGGGIYAGSNLDPTVPGEIFQPNFRNASVGRLDLSGLTVSPRDGQVSYSHTDMVVGNGPFPYSLPFTRTYAPGDRLQAGTPRPGGWKNNYQLSANFVSDPMAALGAGRNVPVDAAVRSIIAIRSGIALLKESVDIAALIKLEVLAHWQIAYTYSNTVMAQTFEGEKTFYKFSHAQNSAGTKIVPATDSRDAIVVGLPLLGSQNPTFATELLTKDGVKYRYIQFTLLAGPSPVNGLPTDCTVPVNPWPLNSFARPYSPSGSLLGTVTWPSGIELTITHSNHCRWPVAQVKNSLGRILNFHYDSVTGALKVDDDVGGREITVTPTEVTLPDKEKIKYEFTGDFTPDYGSAPQGDAKGSRLTKIFLPKSLKVSDPTLAKPDVTLTYDHLFHVESTTDNETPARVTKYFTAGLSQSFRSENQIGPHSVLKYVRKAQYFNIHGDIFRDVSADGKVTASTYDYKGRLISLAAPERNKVTFSYDNRHNRTSVTRVPKPNSPNSSHAESALYATKCTIGLRILPTDIVTVNIDACDRPIQVQDRNENIEYYAYDTKGQMTARRMACPANKTCAETDSARPTWNYTYNLYGQLLDSTDPTGLLTSRYYTERHYNLALSIVDPTGKNIPTLYYYDDVGNACKAIDARGVIGISGAESNGCDVSP